MFLEHALVVVADLPRSCPFVETRIRTDLVDRIGSDLARVHAVEGRGLVEANEWIRRVPVATGPVPPVDHHHIGVRVRDERIGERHSRRAGTDDEIVVSIAAMAPDLNVVGCGR